MYGVVLLAALSGAGEASCLGKKNCYPPPVLDGGGYPGYHNPGGWGRPYGGYGWTGYYCPAYQHVAPPAVTIPPEPLFVPPPRRDEDEDDEDAETPKDGKETPKKNGDKKNGDKKDGDGNGTAEVKKLGIGLADLTAARRKSLGVPADLVGVAVTSAAAKGLASKGGVREGMLLLSVDGDPVNTAKQAADLIGKGSLREGVRLRVIDPLGERSAIVLKE